MSEEKSIRKRNSVALGLIIIVSVLIGFISGVFFDSLIIVEEENDELDFSDWLVFIDMDEVISWGNYTFPENCTGFDLFEVEIEWKWLNSSSIKVYIDIEPKEGVELAKVHVRSLTLVSPSRVQIPISDFEILSIAAHRRIGEPGMFIYQRLKFYIQGESLEIVKAIQNLGDEKS